MVYARIILKWLSPKWNDLNKFANVYNVKGNHHKMAFRKSYYEDNVLSFTLSFHFYLLQVILAFLYRTFMGIMNLFGLETKTCWNVTRVEPLNEVQSCEGTFFSYTAAGLSLMFT